MTSPASRTPISFERAQREQCRRHAALHVDGAATVEAAVADLGLERRARPAVEVAGAHHVDVPVDDQ
jgi:hypothetical protein